MIHDLLVERRGVDPAAETCWRALTELLEHPVAGVERGVLWRFDLPSLEPDAVAGLRHDLEAAAARAGRYVNSNRDRMLWLDGPRSYPVGAPPDGWAVDVWVEDGDGSDAEAQAYFRRTTPALQDLQRGVLWRLWLAVDSRERALALADEITVTRGRRHGLLMNPQAQSAAILAVVGAPGVIR